MTQTLEASLSIDYAPLMMQALRLAEQGRGWTRSNPLVGALVLDRDGDVVGEGYHPELGADHAEVRALRLAGAKATGGTLVVNLEPCCHTGRTGPCCEAIVKAGISRVVVAHADPDPRVSGKGIAYLRTHGVEVVEQVEAASARKTNRHYLLYKQLGRPFVTLKMALSLDGFSADRSQRSQWITGPECRKHVQQLRSVHDGIVVGARTARIDNPRLTVRDLPGPQPDRFVLVGHDTLDAKLALFEGERPALRVGTNSDRSDWVLPADDQGFPDVCAFTSRLGEEGYSSLLVEGGSRLGASYLRARMVDRMVIYYGPMLLGEGLPAVQGWAQDLQDAAQFSEVSVSSLDDGVVWTGYMEAADDVHRAC